MKDKMSKSENLLNLIAEATASYSGEAFFDSLMEQMAKILRVRIAFITECLDQPPTKVRMLAFWRADKLDDKMQYDLVGTPCDDAINNRKNVLVEDRLGELFPKEKGFAESYYGVPIYDNEKRYIIGHMAFLDDKQMSIDGLDATVFDILASRASVEMQRLRAESELRKSEEKYRLLVENQTDLVMRLDLDGLIDFVSPSCCRKFDQSESGILSNDFYEYIQPEDKEVAMLSWQKTLSPPYENLCELRTYTSSGWCWFTWSLKGVIDASGNVVEVIAVGRDVSERRKAEDHARTSLQQLAHVGRISSMGEMASGIAHELNQPLTAILSFAQASLRMLDANMSDIEEQKSILKRIAANAENAGEIIRRMRGFVKKGSSVKSSVDLKLLIKEVIGLLNTELRHNEIAMLLIVDNDLVNIAGDSIQIQQVLVNLIQNAIEAIAEYPMKIKSITVTAQQKSDTEVYVEVRDSGPGIPKEIREKLFDAFITTKSTGLGIGLSICHTIVEAHGSQLAVMSNSGEGAAFHFTLPIFKTD